MATRSAVTSRQEIRSIERDRSMNAMRVFNPGRLWKPQPRILLHRRAVLRRAVGPGRHRRAVGLRCARVEAKAQKLETAPATEEWTQTNGVSEGVVKFGFPKGSLQQSTVDLFSRAGFELKIRERSYFPRIDDEHLDLVLFRSQEIPRYVEEGLLDAGISGLDWIRENNVDVVEVCELHYSKSTTGPARWVVAVDENSPVRSVHDLQDAIVVSELVHTTQKFFEEKGVKLKKVEFSWGATEVKARIPGVAAIVDITETGTSLQANKLRIVDTIMYTTARLVANRQAWGDPLKRRKIEDLALLLQGAIAGRDRIGLKMNAPREKVDQICALVPSSLSPTISPLLDDDFVALEVVVDEKTAREIVPQCQRHGAREILTYALSSMVK